MRRSLSCVIVAVSMSAATPATADPANPTARLLYTRGADATTCPDDGELRNTVSARLGYDPFRDDAPGTVAATIARIGRGLRAVVELRDATGKVTGRRELTSNTTDCSELASAVALAISIAIDPLTLTRPTPPPPPPPPPPKIEPPVEKPPPPKVEPPVEKPPPPPPPAPPPGPSGFRGVVGVHVAFGVSPAPAAVGFTAQAGYRYRRFSIGAEGRADLPSAGEVGRGRIETTLLGAALVPCFHAWWIELCGVGLVGALRGEASGISNPRLDSHVYGAAGGRAGIAIPLWRVLSLEVRGEVLVPVTRITFTVGDLPAWTTPPVQGSVGVGALGQF